MTSCDFGLTSNPRGRQINAECEYLQSHRLRANRSRQHPAAISRTVPSLSGWRSQGYATQACHSILARHCDSQRFTSEKSGGKSRRFSSVRRMMREAYGESRRLKGKSDASLLRDARLCCMRICDMRHAARSAANSPSTRQSKPPARKASATRQTSGNDKATPL